MFRHTHWIEAQLDRLLTNHQASVGYSTCFWHNVLTSRILFDRQGWFHQLQSTANQPYPEALRRAIVAKNYPILRQTQSSYLHQIELALLRNDQVSVNHRVAALLASYFDILFAINRMPHPGEKRLVAIASERCAQCPADLSSHIQELIQAVGNSQVIAQANLLLDGLDELLRAEKLLEA